MKNTSNIILGLVLLGAAVFAITFGITCLKLDAEVENLGNAMELTEPEESVDISAIKIGFDGNTYTLTEFAELEEKPVVVDVLIMEQDGTMSKKQAYVSFDTDDSESIQYIDGAYGRLILPKHYNKE